MKKTGISISIVLILALCYQEGRQLQTYTLGAPGGNSGSPGDSYRTCARAGCHTGTSIPKNGWITSNIEPNGYTPDSIYTITATASHPSTNEFGFEVSPQDLTGNLIGTIITTNSVQTQLKNGGWITHTLNGTAGTNNSKIWSFDWVAPASGPDSFAFYGAFNASNNLNGAEGDSIFTSQLMIYKNPLFSGISESSQKELLIYPNPVKNRLYVNFNVKGRIKILNMDGKELLTINARQIKEVDVSHLIQGMYFLMLETASESQILKFIKQ